MRNSRLWQSRAQNRTSWTPSSKAPVLVSSHRHMRDLLSMDPENNPILWWIPCGSGCWGVLLCSGLAVLMKAMVMVQKNQGPSQDGLPFNFWEAICDKRAQLLSSWDWGSVDCCSESNDSSPQAFLDNHTIACTSSHAITCQSLDDSECCESSYTSHIAACTCNLTTANIPESYDRSQTAVCTSNHSTACKRSLATSSKGTNKRRRDNADGVAAEERPAAMDSLVKDLPDTGMQPMQHVYLCTHILHVVYRPVVRGGHSNSCGARRCGQHFPNQRARHEPRPLACTPTHKSS